MRLFSFGGYGLALAALALVVFGAYDSYPCGSCWLAARCDVTHYQKNIFQQFFFWGVS